MHILIISKCNNTLKAISAIGSTTPLQSFKYNYLQFCTIKIECP
nr:MAG TPA: hypothetical protein [Inoviridae sp.]DAI32432.1 MAG TPA: hypothetical protein [Inoviridae sp.]